MPYGSLLADVVQSSTAATAPTFKDGNGTQIGTLCRAWVNFNGTGTVAIRGSFNVSSITDNGTGDYTVNFTTAMPDANFSIVVTCNSSSNFQFGTSTSQSTSGANVGAVTDAGNRQDSSGVFCISIPLIGEPMTTLINASPTNGLVQTADGSGVLKVQSNGVTTNALAWVNFNGTGTVAIRSSYNVSSITDNGTGDYTINFTNAMPDTSYSVVSQGNTASGYLIRGADDFTARTTAAFRIATYSLAGSQQDSSIVTVAVFGN